MAHELCMWHSMVVKIDWHTITSTVCAFRMLAATALFYAQVSTVLIGAWVMSGWLMLLDV